MTPQEAEFAARVARIESAAGRRTATLYVGPDESYVLDRPDTRAGDASLVILAENASYPLSMVFSFIIGFLAYGLGCWVRFQLTDAAATRPDPDMEMIIGLSVGLLIALLVGQLDRMKAPEQIVAKALGVVCSLLMFHNLVHLFPDVFERLFSPIWTSKVLGSTAARSVLWRGISFTF